MRFLFCCNTILFPVSRTLQQSWKATWEIYHCHNPLSPNVFLQATGWSFIRTIFSTYIALKSDQAPLIAQNNFLTVKTFPFIAKVVVRVFHHFSFGELLVQAQACLLEKGRLLYAFLPFSNSFFYRTSKLHKSFARIVIVELHGFVIDHWMTAHC